MSTLVTKDGTRFELVADDRTPAIGPLTEQGGQVVRLRGYSSHKRHTAPGAAWFEPAECPKTVCYPVFQEQGGDWRMFTYTSRVTEYSE